MEVNISCEENGVFYCDFKLENILLDMCNDVIKLIDFGLVFEV